MADVQTYYAWIVANSDDVAERLVAKLIRRGYTVGPLGRALITRYNEGPSCIIAMSITRAPRNDMERNEYSAIGIRAEVVDVINRIDGRFWSIVVSASAACTWSMGNAPLVQPSEVDPVVTPKQLKEMN
jgi:hypothetical protein